MKRLFGAIESALLQQRSAREIEFARIELTRDIQKSRSEAETRRVQCIFESCKPWVDPMLEDFCSSLGKSAYFSEGEFRKPIILVNGGIERTRSSLKIIERPPGFMSWLKQSKAVWVRNDFISAGLWRGPDMYLWLNISETSEWFSIVGLETYDDVGGKIHLFSEATQDISDSNLAEVLLQFGFAYIERYR